MAESNINLTFTLHLTGYYFIPELRTAMNESAISRFTLIHGYESSDSNFHYSELAGFDSDNNPCWVLTYSELPLDAVIIPLECAEEMIRNITPKKLIEAQNEQS